jgi:hypothetical protein
MDSRGWPTDEHCLPPQSFIDYPRLDLLLDTVWPHGRAHFSTVPNDLRFSTVTAPEFIKICERSLPPQMVFNSQRAQGMLELVLPGVLELRDSGQLPHRLNLQTFPELMKLDALQGLLDQGDLSYQARDSLYHYLQDCDPPHILSKGLGRHSSAMMGLAAIFSVWVDAIDRFLSRIAVSISTAKADYGKAIYRMAIEEYVGLAGHIPNLHEARLIAHLREAGEAEVDFLPHFSLVARGDAFADDLGL